MQVAIDGPAGSGKSSVCKILADKFNLVYVDTGAMYRAAAWLEIKFSDVDIVEILESAEFVLFNRGKNISIEYKGEFFDVTEEIRKPFVSERVSKTAANPDVRRKLVQKQQEYAKHNNVIMEGRDITTVVLPNANIKVFLTASTNERANRRFEELKEKVYGLTYDEVLKNIVDRDTADSNRSNSPLTQSKDAVFIDTTGLSLDDVCIKIGRLIESYGKRNNCEKE